MSERLNKARQQLAQVEALLRDDPKNELLVTLANECREAVCVAEALVNSTEKGPSSSTWTSTSNGASVTSQKQQPIENESETNLDFLPGQRCEVKKDASKWHGAFITQRLPEFTYRVQRLFDSAEFVVKGSEEIKPIGPPATLNHDALIPGLRVRAKYSGDGKYYQAVVEKKTDHGCTVRFEGYEDDDPEHVALEHIRIAEVGEAASLRPEIEIPKHLIVNPDDSDDTKARKLKQQKALRRKARDEVVEKIHSNKQGVWQNFQATNKRAKGSLTGIGSSQFHVNPDGRVGVSKPSN